MFLKKILVTRFFSSKKNPGWPYRIFLAALIVISSALFIARIPAVFQRLTCPFQVTQAEAYKVEFGRILARGESLYPDPNQGPYLYSDYPPLFPALQALPQVLGEKNPWLPGRLLAFAGFLGCATALGLWGWAHWDKVSAMVLVLLFLLSPTWTLGGSMARADCAMIFLAFLAFLLLASGEEGKPDGEKPPRNSRIIPAGLLTATAFFIKQNAALVAMAFFLHCALNRHWRKLFLYLASFLGPVVFFSAWLQWTTHGQYLNYTFLWVPLGYQFQWFVDLFKDGFLPECGWLMGATLLAWVTRETSHLLRCQMVISALWLLGLGRAGSAESFFLEFILYGIFFLGEAWARKENTLPSPPAALAWAKPGLFPAILGLGLSFFGRYPAPPVPTIQERQMKSEMLSLYAGEGQHLALDADLLVMAGKKVWLQPMEFTQLVEKGRWSPEPLLRDIRLKKFATVELYDVPKQYLLPEEAVAEIQRNYHVVVRKYGRLWLEPKH